MALCDITKGQVCVIDRLKSFSTNSLYISRIISFTSSCSLWKCFWLLWNYFCLTWPKLLLREELTFLLLIGGCVWHARMNEGKEEEKHLKDLVQPGPPGRGVTNRFYNVHPPESSDASWWVTDVLLSALFPEAAEAAALCCTCGGSSESCSQPEREKSLTPDSLASLREPLQ